MNTNTAVIIPANAPAPTNAAPLKFDDTLKPLINIPDVWFWVIVAVVVIILAVAGWFFWKYWRKKKSMVPVVPPVPPHIRARQMLDKALGLISEPKLFSIAVSDTIRIYLEERFNFHAPDRTTEEFLYELQSTNLLTPDQKESLAQFLASCDLIKFARYEPTETELRALHGSAVRLVDETEPMLAPPPIPSSAPATP
jgi:hypothetical protein